MWREPWLTGTASIPVVSEPCWLADPHTQPDVPPTASCPWVFLHDLVGPKVGSSGVLLDQVRPGLLVLTTWATAAGWDAAVWSSYHGPLTGPGSHTSPTCSAHIDLPCRRGNMAWQADSRCETSEVASGTSQCLQRMLCPSPVPPETSFQWEHMAVSSGEDVQWGVTTCPESTVTRWVT